MKADIIIQARIWSSRLPAKTMLYLSWKPVLYHVIERLKKCKNINNIIIATTTNKEDDIIERWCIKNNIKYYRWSSNNVLNRYYETAKKYNSDLIVRITSDCPFIEPEIIDWLVNNFNKNKIDYKSNCLKRIFPRWLDCEIFTFNILEKANNNAKTLAEKEHVTPYIIKNWKIEKYIVSKEYISNARLTLDELKDYELINLLYDKFYKNWEIIETKKIIKFLEENIDIKNINNNVEQKKI